MVQQTAAPSDEPSNPWICQCRSTFWVTSFISPVATRLLQFITPGCFHNEKKLSLFLPVCPRYLCLRVASKSNQVFPLTMTQRSFQKNKRVSSLCISLGVSVLYFCPSTGDIGGQMGLFIGASILTILELFDYAYEVCFKFLTVIYTC